jgi:hypothetical protein
MMMRPMARLNSSAFIVAFGYGHPGCLLGSGVCVLGVN